MQSLLETIFKCTLPGSLWILIIIVFGIVTYQYFLVHFFQYLSIAVGLYRNIKNFAKLITHSAIIVVVGWNFEWGWFLHLLKLIVEGLKYLMKKIMRSVLIKKHGSDIFVRHFKSFWLLAWKNSANFIYHFIFNIFSEQLYYF